MSLLEQLPSIIFGQLPVLDFKLPEPLLHVVDWLTPAAGIRGRRKVRKSLLQIADFFSSQLLGTVELCFNPKQFFPGSRCLWRLAFGLNLPTQPLHLALPLLCREGLGR